MIDSAVLAEAIQTQIAGSVERSVQEYVENIVRTLAMDQAWINKMEQQINESITRRIGQRLSLVDVNSVVLAAVEPAVKKWFADHQSSKGIMDLAKDTELTLDEQSVKVQHKLSTADLKVSADAEISQTLTVKNLVVRGTINTDNQSWQVLTTALAQKTMDQLTDQWKQDLVSSVTEQITQKGIEFDKVMIGGSNLIDNDTLNPMIKHSSLTQIGALENLCVTGPADLGHCLAVRPRRVGINTEHPDMALSVWDEEVALIFGKHKDQTAYVGTLRPQNLIIGINRSPAITIDDRAHVTIQYLTVGRHRICHEPECPNYSGTKGDIVFNSNPKNDGVWGWQCLGAFKWIPLRSQ